MYSGNRNSHHLKIQHRLVHVQKYFVPRHMNTEKNTLKRKRLEAFLDVFDAEGDNLCAHLTLLSGSTVQKDEVHGRKTAC
jgi:hypothetical protein